MTETHILISHIKAELAVISAYRLQTIRPGLDGLMTCCKVGRDTKQDVLRQLGLTAMALAT